MSSEREEYLYEVLQVDPGASQEVIQGAYRALLKERVTARSLWQSIP